MAFSSTWTCIPKGENKAQCNLVMRHSGSLALVYKCWEKFYQISLINQYAPMSVVSLVTNSLWIIVMHYQTFWILWVCSLMWSQIKYKHIGTSISINSLDTNILLGCMINKQMLHWRVQNKENYTPSLTGKIALEQMSCTEVLHFRDIFSTSQINNSLTDNSPSSSYSLMSIKSLLAQILQQYDSNMIIWHSDLNHYCLSNENVVLA